MTWGLREWEPCASLEERLPLWMLKNTNFMLNKDEAWVTQDCRFILLLKVSLVIRLVWVILGGSLSWQGVLQLWSSSPLSCKQLWGVETVWTISHNHGEGFGCRCAYSSPCDCSSWKSLSNCLSLSWTGGDVWISFNLSSKQWVAPR